MPGLRSGRQVSAQSDLEAAPIGLVQQQILGAEDTVLLESFALYEPSINSHNSIDYKKST